MFEGTPFNYDISSWNVSKVGNMNSMFKNATAFKQNISGWSVSNVTNISNMFSGATKFNRDISNWDISSVPDSGYSNYGLNANQMPELFYTSSKYYFNANTVDITNKTVLRDAINEWMNTSSRTTAEGRYGGHIGTWDVTNVTDMSGLIGSTDYTTSFQ